MGLKFLNKIAVVQMWPEIKAAEDEVIARIQNTCKKIGIEVVLINTAGALVDSPEKQIAPDHVDFVIHLHFETPKTYDAFSFVALWNPLNFYFEWGYRKFSNNITTHDDFLSCDSPSADDHIKRMILNDESHFEPHFNLFHSLSTPICKPSLGKQKLFYVGINWEKLGKGEGRHQDLLKSLDKSGDLVIYGPEIFQGVKVWEGFKSYAGSLPFDGESVIRAIDEAGITLVLSSQAHKESELMSNRLFEGLAAGSVIIADENKFARKHLGDTLLYIKTEGVTPQEITSQVKEHLKWIDGNQDKAITMAKKAQQIFKEKFDMGLSIRKIYEELPQRKALLAKSFLHQKNNFSLTIIGFLARYSQSNLNRVVGDFEKQTYERKKLILIVDESDYKNHKKNINNVLQISNNIELKVVKIYKRDTSGTLVPKNRFGKVINNVLCNLPEDELVSVLLCNESVFSDHYSSLVRAFENNENLDVAYTNILLTHQDNNNKCFTLSDKIRPFNQNYNNPNGYSRFLFKNKRENWRTTTLNYLGWGIMDAIYSKSKESKRVGRASSILDIQNIPYHSGLIQSFTRDMELLIDTMGDNELREFSVESFGDQVLDSSIDSKINLAEYSLDERRKMIAMLFDALKLPLWVKFGLRRIYRIFLK